MPIVANDLGHVAEHNRLSGVPLGTLTGGYAQAVVNQTGISAIADLTGLTVTVTVGSGRRIRISGNVGVLQRTSAATADVDIFEGVTQLRRAFTGLAINGAQTLAPSVVLTPSAGAHTYKLRAATTAGTVETVAAATDPCWILVEDIGV